MGARFNEAAIPLDILKDLPVLEEFILAVAKSEYKKDNPGCKRAPRNFTKEVSLALAGVESGSAKPLIVLLLSGTLLFSVAQEYLERARNSVIDAISASVRNEDPRKHLDESHLVFFERVGRWLEGDESIVFEVPGDDRRATLNMETRKSLVLSIPGCEEFTQKISLIGTVPTIDQQKGLWEICLRDGRTVEAPIGDLQRRDIFEALEGFADGLRIAVEGVGCFGRDNRLIRLKTVESIATIDPLDVPTRLDEFRELEDGWLEEGAVAPNPMGLDWLSSAFSDKYPGDLTLPYVYPTPEGGVQMEWTWGRHDASLEINLDSHEAYWHSLDLQSGGHEELTLDMDDENGWKILEEVIRRASA